MSEAFIVRRGGGGGGGAGATLTVHAPAGATAKIVMGDKTKTKAVDNSGAAVFSGLAGGEWLASIYDNTHEETTPVPVSVTTDYAVTLAFFAAYININYPAGSTCTVRKGSVVLTAPDTAGQWTCAVPEPGTWTVTAATVVNSRSQDVEITTQGQTATVALTFSVYLFEPGDQHTNLTGGWTGGTITNDSISISSGAGNSAQRSITNNAVDFTGYTTLKFRVSAQVPSGAQAYCGVGSKTSDASFDAKTSVATGTDQTYSVPLNAVEEGNVKIYVARNAANYNGASMTCTHVWLE